MSSTKQSSRVWLVTGASAGIGLDMTRHLLQLGETVVATMRNPTVFKQQLGSVAFDEKKLLVLPLDVTKVENIQTTFARARKEFGRVDVVFNNAGIALMAEVETMTLEIAREMFEINFWGATNVAREAMQVFREHNGGQPSYLINMSSSVSFGAPALGGYYAATKYALNGLIETLNKELDPAWNIKIILVEMGPHETRGMGVAGETLKSIPIHPAYNHPELATFKMRGVFGNLPPGMLGDASKAVSQIELLSRLEEPPLHFPLGAIAIAGAVEQGNKYLEAAKEAEKRSIDN